MSNNTVAAIAIVGICAALSFMIYEIAHAPHRCEDSISIINWAEAIHTCSGGAKVELSKLDGKNVVICHCPDQIK